MPLLHLSLIALWLWFILGLSYYISLEKPLVNKPAMVIVMLPNIVVLIAFVILWYLLQFSANCIRAASRAVWGVDFQGG